MGVDAYGAGVLDPSKNVEYIVAAAVQRLDDLRAVDHQAYLLLKVAEAKGLADLRAVDVQRAADLRGEHEKYNAATHKYLETTFDREREHVAQLSELRAEHAREINAKEASRIDSIRLADREESNRRVAEAATAVTVLAKQTSDLSSTLGTQVQATAAAAEIRFTSVTGDLVKRLSDLERSTSEGKGKAGVSDPQLDRLTTLVETMARAQDRGTGKVEGIGSAGAFALGLALVLAALITVGGFVFTRNGGSSVPQVVVTTPATTVSPQK